MKYSNFLPLLLLLFFSTASNSDESFFGNPEIISLFKGANPDHILLVAFPDQHINRIQGVSPSSYRRRGKYHSSTWSQRVTSQIADEYHLQKITEWPMTEVGIHCAVYLVPDTQSVKKVKLQLADDGRVEIVQRMHQFKTQSHQYNDPYYQLQENLHDIQIDLAHGISTGRNVDIAMIDTGVDLIHPDLIGQIKYFKNFSPDLARHISNNIHGTAVAGLLVARSDNKTGIIGVAPDASLFALKACWADKPNSFAATCNSFTLALAINAAIKLRPKILNMSLTGPDDALLTILLKKAIADGIIVVAADPGKNSDNERFPASLKNVIPVQALKRSDLNKSLLGQSIDAPGDHILTTLPNGTYDFVSGSSLSAAQVTGIVALLMELKPDLTLDEAISILHQSALMPTKTAALRKSNGVNANLAVLQLCDEINCGAY